MTDLARLTRKLRIFLCHSSGDKETVRELYRRLDADGFEPWFDEENLLPGQNWNSEIRRAVQCSDVVLVCLSRTSVGKKGYVQKEVRYALDIADEQPEDIVFLIPVRLDDVTVPSRLSQWQWVNLFDQNGYERLVKALRHRVEAIHIPSLIPERDELGDRGLANSFHRSSYLEEVSSEADGASRAASVIEGKLTGEYLDAEVIRLNGSSPITLPSTFVHAVILVVDLLVMSISSLPFMAVFRMADTSFTIPSSRLASATIVVLVSVFYLVFTQSIAGRTFGMMLTGTSVVDSHSHQPVTAERAFLRSVGFLSLLRLA